MDCRQVSAVPRERLVSSLHATRGAGNPAHANTRLRSREIAAVPAVFSGHDAELPPSPARRAESAPATEFTDLPWLAPTQNEARHKLQRRLVEAWTQPDTPSSRVHGLETTVGLISRLEADVLRIDELLGSLQSLWLSEAEWRELYGLMKRARSNPMLEPSLTLVRADRLDPDSAAVRGPSRLEDRLVRSVQSGALSSCEAKLLQDSLCQLLFFSHPYLYSREHLQPRDVGLQDIAKPMEVRLTTGEGAAAAVTSHIVPGTVFLQSFPGNCLADASARQCGTVRLPPIPGVAHSSLTNAGGETLFRGLHHDLIDPGEHYDEYIGRLSDDQLRTLIRDRLLMSTSRSRREGLERSVDRTVAATRDDLKTLSYGGELIRRLIVAQEVRQVIAAALVSDRAKLQSALHGETVEIDLFNIALLRWDDFKCWGPQGERFSFANGKTFPLCLKRPDGQLQPVSVNLKVRDFAFWVDDESRDILDNFSCDHGTVQLVGRPGSQELGAGVMERLKDLSSRFPKLSDELVKSGYTQLRALPAQFLDRPDRLKARNRMAGLTGEMARLAKSARTLEQAARQLKELWSNLGEQRSPVDAYAMSSRLALVGYLMGATPVLRSASGAGLTRELDARVKILATVADGENGHIPSIGLH